MTQSTPRKPMQLVLIFVSGFFFLGSSLYGLIGMFTRQPPTAQQSNPEEKALESLKVQVKGYQKVLEREPNNPIALQGLVETNLKLKDFKSAVEPMKKLVQLNPNNTQYKELLAAIENKANQPQPETKNKVNSSPTPTP